MDATALRGLLARPDLHLQPVLAEDELDPGCLDAAVRWVHSSDLPDPTPFLTDDLVLLTNGSQFVAGTGRSGGAGSGGGTDDGGAGSGSGTVDAYVARLRRRGVRALGFGREVVMSDPPPSLIEACRTHRMPLFLVPYQTPFLAIARANAEAIAAADYARRSWSLAAQRAISLAALRPDGLTATIAELSRQLEAGVGLFDASGELTREHPSPAFEPATTTALRTHARQMLRRGTRTGASLTVEGTAFTMQTLGASGRLRGVIAIGGALDDAGRGVVNAVIAMAGLALEQNDGLVRERALMRTALLRSLGSGDASLAEPVARELWGGLPPEPVVVAVAENGDDTIAEWLELQVHERPGTLFHALDAAGLVIVTGTDDTGVLDDIAARFDTRLGVSTPVGYDRFDRGLDEASLALERGTEPVSHFTDHAHAGVLSALDTPAGRALAHDVLGPLLDHDRTAGTDLATTLERWLACDARMDVAADALGVHRHTVRARLAQAQDLLGVDLGSFPVRAELWAALRLG